MLAHEPRARISLRAVLAHPWLRTKGAAATPGSESATAAEEAPMDEDGSDDEDDDGMELDGGGGHTKSPARPVPSSPRSARAKQLRHNNFTASPDSVFSFENAYHDHRRG